jgi:Ca2+-binding RTX toxin-like protein
MNAPTRLSAEIALTAVGRNNPVTIISQSEETDVDLANAGGQKLAAITASGSFSSFTVVWGEQTETDWAVKGQIYGSRGEPIGTEKTFATGISDLASLDARSTGSGDRFDVTWRDGGTFFRQTVYNDGTLIGSVQPATGPDGEYWAFLGGSISNRRTVSLDVVGDDLIVSYSTIDGSDSFAINTTPLAGETAVSVARVGGDYRFSAAWSTLNGEDQYEVRVRSYFVGEPDAAALHDEIVIATDLGAAPIQPEVVGSSGGFVVAWLDASAGEIHAQEFTLAGEPLGDLFVVNDLPLGETADLKISAVTLINGRVAITWETSGDVHVKIIDPRPIGGGPEDDEVIGTNGNDILYGFAGDDHLVGLAGHDELWGGEGADLLEGGTGDDIYYVNDALDEIIELIGGGSDRVRASTDFTLNDGAYVEVIETQDAAGTDPINLTGNDQYNLVIGNAGANVLSGGNGGSEGGDQLQGLAGDDTYLVKTGDHIIELSSGGFDTAMARENYQLVAGAYVEVLRTEDDSSSVAINLTGNDFANTLIGNAGANVLDGGIGADYMVGNGGDDTFVVWEASDVVLEQNAGDGFDRVDSYVDYRLGSHQEVLVLIGGQNGTGHNLANILVGNAGNNVLNGKGGADYMAGNAGDDTFVVDDVGDEVVELSGEGQDQVNSYITYRLGPNLERLSLLGSANVGGTGNELANSLIGNSGANVLNGKAGADSMVGNGGDDTFVVDNAGDEVVELGAADGYDQVNSYIDYQLSAHLERLNLLGSADVDGTGNELANTLAGNSGANVLDGLGGADLMVGLGGNDTFVVDDAGDQVVEQGAGDGFDRVDSSIDYRLGANVEVLVLLGSDDIDGTGHNLANTLVGNSGANVLNGKGGADYMAGNGGDDTYVVHDAGDEVVELRDEGYDQVNSYIDYQFSVVQHLEQLNLLGSANIDGTGNGLANTLIGNSGDNLLNGRDGGDDLRGGAGNDRLLGGAGDDILRGGVGADGFYFTTPLDWFENVDTLVDFFAADDSFFLDQAVFAGFGQTGGISEDAFFAGSAAQDAEDRVIYDQSTGNIFYDSDGMGGGDAVLFAQVAPGTSLSNLDFYVF